MASSDYISREAAEKVFSQPVTMSMCLTLEECKMKNAQRQIDLFVIRGLPAADVRPVVCCKDCVYAYPYGLEIKCTKHSGKADRLGEDATYSEFHDESWFCADGEERKHD